LEIHREETEGSVRFGNSRIELRLDRATGRWVSLTDAKDGTDLLRAGNRVTPILLSVNGWTGGSRGYNQMLTLVDAETVGWHWECEGISCRTEGERASLTARLREGDWRVALQYGLRPDSMRLERRVRIEYAGEGEALLRSFTLRQPFAHLGPPADCYFEAPGYAVRPGRRVCWLPFGPCGPGDVGAFHDAPAWQPPLLGLHNPADRRAVALWAYTETEPFYPQAERTDEGVLLTQQIFLADRFTRGAVREWGAQYLQVFHAEWLEALQEFQAFYDEAGLTVPDAVPEWARAINLYEVHVGTLAGLTLYPTFTPLVADLPRIRDKGYEAVYIMPHVPYPSYSVIDYKNMEIQQGSDAGFRAFIARAHELGLKVFMDVTMHGVMDRRARRLLASLDGRPAGSYPMEPTMPEEHPYLAEHPEWFSRTETGEIAMTYTYAFDHASPAWQEFMTEVFRFYVQEYDLDGFRVDSHTWNFFPNWARDLPYPASASIYGSAQLFKRVLRELQAIKPEVVLYTETAGPLLHGTHALSYNYDETWLLLSLLPLLSRRGLLCHFAESGHVTGPRMTAQEVAQWLAQRRLAMPRGAVKVHHLDCHDTYWRPREFRRDTFGIPAARAVVGFYAFIDGGFMDFNGADDGSEAFYERVVHLRRTQPVLRKGTCDYLAVFPSDPMTFAPLWEWQGRYLLPVIHFGNRPADVTLPLPVGRMALEAPDYAVRDLMADRALPGPRDGLWRPEDLAALSVSVKPYDVLLLDFQPSVTPYPPAPSPTGDEGSECLKFHPPKKL